MNGHQNENYSISKIRTKFSTDKTFRWTKFSTPSRNFDRFVRFLPDFCIEILDKIFDGQNVSSYKIFDTKLKFRHFCPTNFCPIRYLTFSGIGKYKTPFAHLKFLFVGSILLRSDCLPLDRSDNIVWSDVEARSMPWDWDCFGPSLNLWNSFKIIILHPLNARYFPLRLSQSIVGLVVSSESVSSTLNNNLRNNVTKRHWISCAKTKRK